jgi:hypothetical protein
MVLCAYQFGMRPVQIAKLQMRNVRIWHDVSESMPAVHLTFHMAKQKSESSRRPLTRKVKRECHAARRRRTWWLQQVGEIL